MKDDLFLASYNEHSKRHAVLDDNGVTGWLYLHGPSEDSNRPGSISCAVIVYNRIEAIELEDIKDYESEPPPIAGSYASENAQCSSPEEHEWNITWSNDGESTILLRNGVPWCLILDGEKQGYSKAINQVGPWGKPWDFEKEKQFG